MAASSATERHGAGLRPANAPPRLRHLSPVWRRPSTPLPPASPANCLPSPMTDPTRRTSCSISPCATSRPKRGDYYRIAKLGAHASPSPYTGPPAARRAPTPGSLIRRGPGARAGHRSYPRRWVEQQAGRNRDAGRRARLDPAHDARRGEYPPAPAAGVIPCYIGDVHPLLEQADIPPIPELDATYWMIVHRDLRRAHRVRFPCVIDWM